MHPVAVLKVSDLALSIRIGCTSEERLRTQEVRVSFQIKTQKLPKACLSDVLDETICYETLIGRIRHLIMDTRGEFKTVEKLGHDCFQDLKTQIPADARLFLSIHKINPPIDSLKGGVHFELFDEGFHS